MLRNLVIGQNLGQDQRFREKFDVAVARAVAEMRVLGNYKRQKSLLFAPWVYSQDLKYIYYL